MGHDFAAVRVLDGEIEGVRVDGGSIHTPGLLGESGEGLLQFDKLFEIIVIERVGLAQGATGVELVVPDLAGGCYLSRRTAPRS